MKLRLGITPKLTFIFVGFAAILLAGVASLAYTNGQSALRQATISELQSIATEKDSALIEWEQDKQNAVQTIAQLPELQETLSAFRAAPEGSPEALAAHNQLIDRLSPWAGDDKEFLRLLVMNPETAEIIAASNTHEEGKFKENFPYFIHGREGPYLQNAYYSPELQDVAMTISAPIKASDGRLLGVLAARLDLNQLNAIIQRRSGLRQTDDAFLVSASNLFVTQPRFISDPAVLRRGIHTEAIKRCLQHEDGALAYQDYRDEPVIGIYRWLPEFDVCLIVKLDQAEALQPSRAFGQTILILSLAALGIASVLATGLARTIVRPLQSLQSGVARFGQGDLDARLPEISMDELGVLAHEFNQMATSLAEKDAQLREYATQLEQKVDERTAALQQSEERFSKAFRASPVALSFTRLADGSFTDVNESFLRLFGYSRGEVIGRTAIELKMYSSPEERAELVRRLREQGFIRDFEMTTRTKSGEAIRVLFSTEMVELNGEIHALATIIDITERTRAVAALRESESLKTSILQSALDCIITIDHQGLIIEFNPAAQATFGYSLEQVLGKELVDLIIPPSLRARHRHGFKRYLTTGESNILGRRLELIGMRADGSEFPVELTIQRVTDSDPPIFTGFLRDITERKQADEALRERERQMTALITSLEDIIFEFDEQGTYLNVWTGDESMLAQPKEQLLGRRINDILGAENGRPFTEAVKRVLASGRSETIEYPLDVLGGQRWFMARISPIIARDTPHRTASMLIRDITERKRAEEQNRFQANLVASVADAIIATDMQLNIQSWNAGAETMYGWKAEEVIGRPAQEILDSDFLENTRETVTKQIMEQGHWQGEVRQLRSDGTRIPTLSSVSLYKDSEGKPAGIVAVNRDITDLKRAEDALREGEEHARSLLNLSKQLERAQTYSEALDAALEQVKAALGYQNVWTYLLAEDKQQLRLLTTSGGKSQEFVDEFPILTIKGDRFLEEIVEGKDIVVVEDARSDPRTNKEIVAQLGNRTIVNVPIRLMERHLGAFGTGSFGDEGVRVPTTAQLDYLRALASHMAVTLDRIHLLNEHKRAEEDIRKLNEELEERVVERTQQLELANRELESGKREIQNIFDSMTTLNAKVALDGKLLLVNRIAAQASGLSLDELMRTNFLEGQWWAFDPEVQARVRNAFAEACSGKSINYDERIFVFGQVLTISFSLTPMLGNDGRVEYILAEARDVTKLKEIEGTLQARTAQLEAANQELDAFSYSVSHDLRAPLRSIDGFSQALLEDYSQELPAEGQKYLERVRKSTQHMAALIDDLLNLSRVTRAPLQAASVDLSRLAKSIAAELQSTQPERKATFQIAPNLRGRGDVHLLRAVLQNLLSNAWKYTSRREQAEIEFGAKREGDEIIYFIRDNGAGFDMAYADKLFGAFQRLHAASEFPGTGVGLATVQRILHRHGGRIWAEAEVDRGATFFFSLPGDERVSLRVAPKEQDSMSKRAKEII